MKIKLYILTTLLISLSLFMILDSPKVMSSNPHQRSRKDILIFAYCLRLDLEVFLSERKFKDKEFLIEEVTDFIIKYANKNTNTELRASDYIAFDTEKLVISVVEFLPKSKLFTERLTVNKTQLIWDEQQKKVSCSKLQTDYILDRGKTIWNINDRK